MTCKLPLLTDEIYFTAFVLSCMPFSINQQIYKLCVFAGKIDKTNT